MSESKIIRNETVTRTRIDDLPVVGEELSPEQLKLVVGGARFNGPTCSSTCSCEYSDDGQGY